MTLLSLSIVLFCFFSGDYNRMEFFGDAILKYVCSDYLYKTFPDHQEGPLTVSIIQMKDFLNDSLRIICRLIRDILPQDGHIAICQL